MLHHCIHAYFKHIFLFHNGGYAHTVLQCPAPLGFSSISTEGMRTWKNIVECFFGGYQNFTPDIVYFSILLPLCINVTKYKEKRRNIYIYGCLPMRDNSHWSIFRWGKNNILQTGLTLISIISGRRCINFRAQKKNPPPHFSLHELINFSTLKVK